MNASLVWWRRRPAALTCSLAMLDPAEGGDIGYVEDFALAKDRADALKALIPGTEDYYYYHCLHLLNTGQFDKVITLTRPWLERFGQTARLTEIQTRHALLSYDKDPKNTLAYLTRRLNLHFDHQKETVGPAPGLPTALDPKLISRPRLLADSLARWTNLDNFEDVALDWLAGEDLNWERRRNLLQRLQRPDIAGLIPLIVADLQAMHAPDFGAYPVHGLLTRAQLAQLLKQRPDLLNHAFLVRAYVTRLQPGADDDWRRDRKLTEAYLDRLQKFVARLAPVHNALKAHVLYHRLAFDRAAGVYDPERFLAYLQLPRQQPYMARALNEKDESRRFPADLNADFAALTLLPRVGPDEPLVRSYLQHFFREGAVPKTYEPYIDDVYLAHLAAETAIEDGRGDPETWASKLPPEQFRRLKDRIDIDFAFTNKTDYAADEPVRLDLFVKNVPTLLVKVFEINTRGVYRARLQEIDTDLNLDGLVANAEKTYRFDDPPLRRVARPFAFPELNKPGVYVIDFIGAGKSSRALVRKGRLRALATTGPAGQQVRVVDERNRAVNDAVVWLGGQEYAPDKDGVVTVPFTAEPGRRPIVLTRGELSSLDYLQHQPEAYRLAAGIHVDRESLLTGRTTQLLLRPGLYLNDAPVSLRLLEDVRLRLTSVDHNDVPSSTEVANFALFEDRESTHELRVPPRLKTLTVTLTARVKVQSTGKPADLAVSHTVALNGIDRTDRIEDLHLARFGPDYVLELLGRTGEAKPERAVQVALKHREFREPVRVTLKTDRQGRVTLGPLADIVTVTATGPEGTAHTWTLATDAFTYRGLMHAVAGKPVRLPYLGTADKPTRADYALFEVRGNDIRADRFDALAIRDGLLELSDLPPGDYDLWQKRVGDRIRIRVVDGATVAGFVLGATRHLELPALEPVHVRSITAGAEAVTVQLGGVSKFARVHVFATRYQPAFSAFADLSKVREAALTGTVPGHAESVYLTGRNIGDEYRYVLDRRGQKKFPGVMLDRPSLLLNPWAVRTTETAEQLAQGGDEFRSGGGFNAPSSMAPPATPAPAAVRPPAEGGDFANLDFLADASAVLLNLVPDKNGTVTVPRKLLVPHAMIHVVAVDPVSTTYRSVTLPETPATFADLRLRKGLDPAKHFTQQKQVSVLAAGKPLVLPDLLGSRFQMIDSLPRVYGYYATLTKNATLAEFAFVPTWPTLKAEQKRALYSKHACHELHFFLYQKDRPFFDEVVKPYLRNKKDKTFLDRWLLDEDVTDYSQPWNYGRLNTVERVLLAQRIANEPPRTLRHLADLLRLLPPNRERELFLFHVGLEDTALATDEKILGNLRKEQERLSRRLNQNEDRLEELHAAPKPKAGEMPPGVGAAMDAPKEMDADEKGSPRGGTELAEGAARKKDLASRAGASKASGGRRSDFFGLNAGRLKDVRQLYRRLDPTQEWAENNYYKLPIQRQIADLVPVGPFWRDYAAHDGKTPFLSRHFGQASGSFTEMMFALAVLDLPFDAGKHDLKFADGGMTLTPGSPVIAFHEEVRPADGKGGGVQVLVSQNLYRHGDRYRDENGEKVDKFVTDEFLTQTVYGCQVVVTNATSARQKLTALIQLPVGAVPVANGQFTRSVPLDLEPYRTGTVDYFFYFPKAGKFPHYPVQVARNEQFVTAAQPLTLTVVDKPSKVDTGSWDFVSQHGSDADVLAFLNRENVAALNLDRIAFRLRDRGFFEAVTRLLAARQQYVSTLWSYGLFHADVPTAREYLRHSEQIVAECGGPLVSPLLTVDPVARHSYEHLEYKPLVNARAHALGQRRQIVNDRLLEQYHRFLKTLTYSDTLDDPALLAVTYYLLLQDRVEEAKGAFARVAADRVATRLQYDYCAAWLALADEAGAGTGDRHTPRRAPG
ncbi:MAG: hypothetical protein U0736_03140 [Gemmataceae bacterium]